MSNRKFTVSLDGETRVTLKIHNIRLTLEQYRTLQSASGANDVETWLNSEIQRWVKQLVGL